MAKVEVRNWDNKKVGEVELEASVFAAPVNKSALYEVVKWQLACRRQGTHKAKTRGEVRGGGKKPFKQKGTGNARQGSSRSPLMPGGGITFGPTPRDYSYTLPKQVRRVALRSALSHLVSEGKLIVVDSMQSEGKTKDVAERLKSFGLNKAVLLDAELNAQFQRASRNLPKFRYYGVEGLNVYDLLKYGTAIVTKECVNKIADRLKEVK